MAAIADKVRRQNILKLWQLTKAHYYEAIIALVIFAVVASF